MTESAQQQVQAKVVRKSDMAGMGCLVQGLGLVLGVVLFVFIPVIGWVLGPLVGVGMLAAGSQMALKWECSSCRNPVASKRVKVCPTCHARLGK